MKRLWIQLVALVALAVSLLNAQEIIWQRTYGTSGEERCLDIATLPDSGFIMVGWTGAYGVSEDVWLVRTDAEGDTSWTRTYGSGSWREVAYDVEPTADGGFLVVGSDYHSGNGLVLKLDANGDSVWSSECPVEAPVHFRSGRQTDDGGYLLAGYVSRSDHTNILAQKIDANGSYIWADTHGTTGTHYRAYELQELESGEMVIAGGALSPGSGTWDLYLLKLGSLGEFVWQAQYGGEYFDYGYSVQIEGDSGFVVAGTRDSQSPTGGSAWLLKLDENGDTVWTRTYRADGGGWSASYSLTRSLDSGYVLAGEGAGGIYTVSVEPSGDTNWTIQQGLPYADNLNAISTTLDSCYAVGGYVHSFGNGSYDFYFAKIGSVPQYTCGDADGNSLVNISDAVYLISYIFGGGSAPNPLESGDCDCNELVNISDAVYLIAYIFGGGPAPCAECP